MNPVAEDILMHYGMPRRSGRYPWGSGDEPYQRTRDFISRVDELKKTGWKPTAENIKKEFGISVKDYRNEVALARIQRRTLEMERARALRDDGKNNSEIGRIMGKPESSIRSLFDEEAASRMEKIKNTVDFLREQVDKKKMVDVGSNVERELNISKERLDLALYYLKEKEGYEVYGGRMDQVTNPGQKTTQKVLCVPGTEHKEIYEYDKVKTLTDYVSHDGGETFDKFVYPKSMDSRRLMIRYADDIGPDGARGIDKDGVVELRRGVPDLSLGNDHYAQVRILVDNNKYIKGMAVYSDNMPKGVDVVFNTNKTSDKSMAEVLKDIKPDPDNPFGSLIKAGGQSYYVDKDGNRQLSLINKRASEGDWTDWKDALPSQFLSKQNMELASKQLSLARADKAAEFDEICSLENPTIKKHLLEKFASNCDSAAVHLKAAALPGQKYHVIIPINSLKDNEIYAPQYESGTKLALIRYPHGGTFEIPILTVNNRNTTAKSIIGPQSIDAVGINKHNADRLSGADFDGDTVMCIPTHDRSGKVKITSTPPLKQLEGFDPKLAYPERKGMKYMKDPVTGKDATQSEMGKISNLITDMTLAGADQDELARAVKHSMVVIDAAKHKLDYRRSEYDNNIAELRRTYQVKVDKNGNTRYGGASTIISRASGEYTVNKRQGTPKVNLKGKEWYDPSKPEGSLIYKNADDLYYPVRKYNKDTHIMTISTTTGKKVTYDVTDAAARELYTPVKRVSDTGEVTYTDKTGSINYKVKARTQKSTNMAETDDAYTLVSKAKHPMELLYADHANYMKAMANKARIEIAKTGKIKYDANAKKEYQTEVSSLMSKLNDALKNSVRERAAQRMANAEVASKKASDPNMKSGDIKKAGQQALTKYRSEVGSVSRKDRNIEITDREWSAIQAGAISESQLKKILNNTDIDKLRERATPKATTTLSQAKINRIKAMSSSNYSINEIAKSLGIPTSTVSKYLKGVN